VETVGICRCPVECSCATLTLSSLGWHVFNSCRGVCNAPYLCSQIPDVLYLKRAPTWCFTKTFNILNPAINKHRTEIWSPGSLNITAGVVYRSTWRKAAWGFRFAAVFCVSVRTAGIRPICSCFQVNPVYVVPHIITVHFQALPRFKTCLTLRILTNAECFKKSFTTLKAYINLFRGHEQCFELSQCSKTHPVLPGIVTVHMTFTGNAICFKKSFATLKAYINLFRGHEQCFELSQCSKTHPVLPGIVTAQCDFHW
jgi:hypothetical protein